MICIHVHSTIGHSPDYEVLVSESEVYKAFVERVGSLISRLREDYPGTVFDVGLTEDVVPTELCRCPACGGRDVTRL